MKRGDKYDWITGHPPPPLEPHSETKHLLLKGYLEAYVKILLSNFLSRNLRLTIVDGFAGGGEYIKAGQADFVDGSPLVALKAIQAAHAEIAQTRHAELHINSEFHFVDTKAAHLDYLRQVLQRRGYGPQLDESIHLHTGAFVEHATAIVERIITRSQRSRRAIFILDQYAYDQVPFQLIHSIFQQLPDAEFIITFGVSSLQSFLTDSDQCRRILDRIGLAPHVSLERIELWKKQGGYQQIIQEQLSAGIKSATGARYMTLYYLRPIQGWTYWLVHLSNNLRAREAMTDLHWQFQNTFSHSLNPGILKLGYDARTDGGNFGQLALGFGTEFSFNDVARQACKQSIGEELIRTLFAKRELSFLQLREMAAMSPATQDIVAQSLLPYLEAKDIAIVTKHNGNRRGVTTLDAEDKVIALQRSFHFL